MDSNLCLCKRPACPTPLTLHVSRTFTLSDRHLTGKAVNVVHGQQGTADWHRQRLYKIGGSSARACAHARTHSSRAKCAAKACGCDSSSPEAAALEWGKTHESTAIYCYTQQLQQPGGTAIAWYKGPVPSSGAFWSEKKYLEYLQLDVAVHEPELKVDSGIQVLESTDIWHLFSSPDAVALPSRTGSCYGIEIKCPSSLINSPTPVTAVEYLFGGTSPKHSYIAQCLQLQHLLPGAYVDFVVWTPNSTGIGQCSILRLEPDGGTFVDEVLSRTHPMASHYIFPMKTWINDQADFPGPGDTFSRAAQLLTDGKQQKHKCSCGRERLCMNSCPEGQCSCRCVLRCLLPGTHAADCTCADSLMPSLEPVENQEPRPPARVAKAQFPWNDAQLGILEEHWSSMQSNEQSSSTCLSKQQAAALKTALNAEPGCSRCVVGDVRAYFTSRQKAVQRDAAEAWSPSAETTARLQQHFEGHAGRMKIADAAAAIKQLELPEDVTRKHITNWWKSAGRAHQQQQRQQQQSSTAAGDQQPPARRRKQRRGGAQTRGLPQAPAFAADQDWTAAGAA